MNFLLESLKMIIISIQIDERFFVRFQFSAIPSSRIDSSISESVVKPFLFKFNIMILDRISPPDT